MINYIYRTHYENIINRITSFFMTVCDTHRRDDMIITATNNAEYKSRRDEIIIKKYKIQNPE